MRALVTGGGGFLGRYIVEQLLARGDQVRVLGRRDYPDLAAIGVNCLRGDVADAQIVSQACADQDVVFHTAAIAGIWGRWEDFYQANVVGTQNILAGCREHGVGKLVYTSSPSVTFDGTDQNGVDESVPYPTRWLAHYPRSKAIAEQQVLAANQPGKLLTCALRPHLIWGPRDQHLIPRLLQRAKSGKLRIVGDGKNRVDMIYVENAAVAHLQAAAALVAGGAVCGNAYFLSQGEPVVCWDWINELLELAKIPKLERKISYRAAFAIGRLLETAYKIARKYDTEPRMTRFLAAQLATNHYFDLSAARRDFGYQPQINMKEGMRRLAETL
ncbi:NAD-dependent epimerase/dehydratase family protein [Blastopirellula marina]|uniref:3-beta-hydroxysteroid dehydrogenase n=1 Tax=Blastopirellula marina DSM 3645 TaxID=314230 RepID=A3ZXC4_9BACT|nr:NAD-dependent epimerase/dehydratase family protein [Blastopirellula marina]EAQ78839.1 3-beta-hydroxysteroid dehydrogenase [Blastopirellula marina DSM 3645]